MTIETLEGRTLMSAVAPVDATLVATQEPLRTASEFTITFQGALRTTAGQTHSAGVLVSMGDASVR
jgi:hypothetical protein